MKFITWVDIQLSRLDKFLANLRLNLLFTYWIWRDKLFPKRDDRFPCKLCHRLTFGYSGKFHKAICVDCVNSEKGRYVIEFRNGSYYTGIDGDEFGKIWDAKIFRTEEAAEKYMQDNFWAFSWNGGRVEPCQPI